MMFLLTCDKKLTKSQLSPTHASTKRKITDELKHVVSVSLTGKTGGGSRAVKAVSAEAVRRPLVMLTALLVSYVIQA